MEELQGNLIRNVCAMSDANLIEHTSCEKSLCYRYTSLSFL